MLALRSRRVAPVRIGAPQMRFFALIAVLGTILPNSASYQAAVHLPAGIMAILISFVPIFAFPVALLMRVDRFGWARLGGLGLGAAGVLLIVAPGSSLPDPAMVAFVPLALVAPACYALEGNIIARFGTAGMDPVLLLFGASVLGALGTLPMALATGSFIDPRLPWALPDTAILASSLVHAIVYSSYFWLVGRAGSVFAAQVAYLVTGFGVVWSMILLSETYSPWIWLALALVIGGLFLVQPRPKAALAAGHAIGEDAATRRGNRRA